jgi:hypothetical protein
MAPSAILFLRRTNFARLASSKLTNPPAKKAEYTMFSIAIVLFIILFPVLIPAGVSTAGAITDARQRRRERIRYALGNGARSVVKQSI